MNTCQLGTASYVGMKPGGMANSFRTVGGSELSEFRLSYINQINQTFLELWVAVQ